MWGFTELNGALNEPGMNLAFGGECEKEGWGTKLFYARVVLLAGLDRWELLSVKYASLGIFFVKLELAGRTDIAHTLHALQPHEIGLVIKASMNIFIQIFIR